MSKLELRPVVPGEIALPGSIAETDLTLAEIGAIVCFASLQAGETALDQPRFASPEMAATVKTLKDRGILKVKLEGRNLTISLDLCVLEPDQEEPTDGR